MTQSKPSDKDFWEDIRDTVKGGLRDLRDMGDELARQGRLRMDIASTERRLRHATFALGEACYGFTSQQQSVPADDTQIVELTKRIRFYQDEVIRLKAELATSPKNDKTPPPPSSSAPPPSPPSSIPPLMD